MALSKTAKALILKSLQYAEKEELESMKTDLSEEQAECEEIETLVDVELAKR
jgi:hypothetical protein